MNPSSRLAACVLTLLSCGACSPDRVPDGLKRTPAGSGATVRYELYAEPHSAIPFPNDTLSFPDPTSRTGVRLNLQVTAPTQIERRIHEQLNLLEGWGTYAPITVSFDPPLDESDASAVGAARLTAPALDLDNLRRRHQVDDFEFDDDAVYVVNLETGIPVPLDLGSGSFSSALRDLARYGPNDPRATEPNLLWETADETADPATGRADASRSEYEPGFDTDFDGVLDRPNLGDQAACANQIQLKLDEVSQDVRDRCIADNLLNWYERETDTLIVRPLLPLEPSTQYAVVLTDRLVDRAGNPVRSPFDFVYHPSQREAVDRLRRHLLSAELAQNTRYYGDLAGTGLDHVQFSWAFTTGPVVDDLRLLRDGLYGHGPVEWLARDFPAELLAAHVAGVEPPGGRSGDGGQPAGWQERPECRQVADRPYVIRLSQLLPSWQRLSPAELGLESEPQKVAALQALSALDYLVFADYVTPFLLEGGPDSVRRDAALRVNLRTGAGTAERERVQAWIAVPKATANRVQPFPVALYAHRWAGSVVDMLSVAGELARSGLATVAANALWHGPSVEQTELLRRLFADSCYVPAATWGGRSRARDCDGDGVRVDDGGCAFWSPDPVHTRDALRQSVLDALQLVRTVKSFGERQSAQDFDSDGRANLAGDFDADGVPDLGGPDNLYTAWGESLGGLVVMPLGALDPDVVATAALGGSGSLLDIARRTQADGLLPSWILPALGPLLVGMPAAELEPNATRCDPDQVSLRFVVVSGLHEEQVEFSCLDINDPTGGAGLPRGGTLLLTNGSNGERRCARMPANGRFRLSIPADAGDRLELQVFDEPDVVDSYAPRSGCNLTEDAERIELVSTWGRGLVASGSTDATGRLLCAAAGGCTRFADRYYPAGSPLVAIQSGLGLLRQSPRLREHFCLIQHALDGADGISFARYYGLRELPGPGGGRVPATGALVLAPVGDQDMPIDSQLAVARAMGALPFLRPDAGERYPHYADYVTPAQLYAQLGQLTPNQFLVSHQVMEGIARFRRHPPPEGCGANEVVPHAPNECHAACATDADCATDSYCDPTAGACRTAPLVDEQCDELLFDPDALDEDLAGCR
jgi:hypothetical protein